jgi:hypothetical protein
MNGTVKFSPDFSEYWSNWRKQERIAYQRLENPKLAGLDDEVLTRELEYNEQYNKKIALLAEVEKFNEEGNEFARQGDYNKALD